MSDRLVADLFDEDHAHEEFVVALVKRIAREVSIGLSVQVRTAFGGHPRAMKEFRAYQVMLKKGMLADPGPDLVVVVIDGNCATSDRRREIRNATQPQFRNRLVIGCPDPHVERWYLSDPDSFCKVVGHRPVVGREKCERNHYKRLLANAVREGGRPPTLGGVEFAVDPVAEMDLYNASRSLKAFVDDLRSGFVRFTEERGRPKDDSRPKLRDPRVCRADEAATGLAALA